MSNLDKGALWAQCGAYLLGECPYELLGGATARPCDLHLPLPLQPLKDVRPKSLLDP